jgi:hypothetical protein
VKALGQDSRDRPSSMELCFPLQHTLSRICSQLALL